VETSFDPRDARYTLRSIVWKLAYQLHVSVSPVRPSMSPANLEITESVL
jgi:hypothetical protein